jgi:hypothetical protein
MVPAIIYVEILVRKNKKYAANKVASIRSVKLENANRKITVDFFAVGACLLRTLLRLICVPGYRPSREVGGA